jgi:hypothetical protein
MRAEEHPSAALEPHELEHLGHRIDKPRVRGARARSFAFIVVNDTAAGERAPRQRTGRRTTAGPAAGLRPRRAPR